MHHQPMNPEKLKAIVHKVLRAKAPLFSGEISDHTPLGPDGLNIDSIACLEVVLMLEKATGFMLRNENLTADALKTAGSLIEFMARTGRNE